MTREGFRHTGIGVLAVMAMAHAAEAGPSGGPPGAPPPGGGYGPGFSGSSPHGSAYPPDHDDYDYSGPSFNFSVRKAQRPAERKADSGAPDKQTPPDNAQRDDLWDRFKSSLGLGN
jgi:hypothetical protein